MTKIKYILVVAGGIILLTFFSCREKGTEPSEIKPIKRDYVWSVDTLSYPLSFQTTLRAMWASSPTDVYVVGQSDVNRGQMYHYNGQAWRPVELTKNGGGPVNGFVALEAVFGLNPNDVWAVGAKLFFSTKHSSQAYTDSSLIVHFDGSQWKEFSMPAGNILYSIWACSQSDVWVGGAEGAMYHFDGSFWNKINLNGNYSFQSIRGLSKTEVYAVGHLFDRTPPEDSSGSFLFRYDGFAWKIIDSFMSTPGAPPPHFGVSLHSVNNALYSVGLNVYEYKNGLWNKIFDGPVIKVYKSGINNMFAVGYSVFHFNGLDWYEYKQFRSTQNLYWGCYTDGKETFILGTNWGKSFVIHGK